MNSDKPLEEMFDGDDLMVDVEVDFAEIMQPDGVTKEVTIERMVPCESCKGTREREGSESLPCYSCKGTGIKEDALFHRKTRCNTCKGHGKIVQ